MYRLITSFIAAVVLCSGCAATTLPPIAEVDEIRLKSNELGEVMITDSNTIVAVLDFANGFKDGWGVPWYGPPVATLHFEFYSRSKLVANFGLSKNFVTRTPGIGNFLSQRVESGRVHKFARDTHPAILEAVFLTIPKGDESETVIDYWKSVLNELEPGASWPELEVFLKEHSIRISHANDNQFGLGYWRSLELQVVYEGAYVNTAVSAQLQLNPDLSLKKVRFFGYRHAKRVES